MRFSHGPILVAAFAALLAGTNAQAQSNVCTNNTDAFSLARRSRHIIADYERLRTLHLQDMARNADSYLAQTGKEMPWSFGAAGVIDYTSTFGFDVCTNQGPWTGTVTPWLFGSIATFFSNRFGFALEAFAVKTIDNLRASPTEAQTRTADGGYRDPTGELASASSSNTMYGGRLSVADWVTLVGGYIASRAVTNKTGIDGRELLLDHLAAPRAPRIYLGAGVPRFDLFFDLIVDRKDAAADQLELRLDTLPLPWASLVGFVAVGYLHDEAEATLTLGVRNILRHVTVEASVEHRPLRLRYARARIDWDWTWGLTPEKLREYDNTAEAEPHFLFDLGTFAEASWYGSRWLHEQTGRKGAGGAYFGFFARPDITLLMMQLDFYFGLNRPEEIARISQYAGHWQVGVRVHGRLGL